MYQYVKKAASHPTCAVSGARLNGVSLQQKGDIIVAQQFSVYLCAKIEISTWGPCRMHACHAPCCNNEVEELHASGGLAVEIKNKKESFPVFQRMGCVMNGHFAAAPAPSF